MPSSSLFDGVRWSLFFTKEPMRFPKPDFGWLDGTAEDEDSRLLEVVEVRGGGIGACLFGGCEGGSGACLAGATGGGWGIVRGSSLAVGGGGASKCSTAVVSWWSNGCSWLSDVGVTGSIGSLLVSLLSSSSGMQVCSCRGSPPCAEEMDWDESWAFVR